jgi:glycosyltransferase involved in cell wall biosynthesis
VEATGARAVRASMTPSAPRRISIVTPCFNAEHYIEETVRSVVNQRAVTSGRVELEYIIYDGGSSDQTVARARDAAAYSSVAIHSEPDRGMYDALAKGLSSASGDIVAYINAGDYYHPCAFDVVLDVFERPQVQWLTGYAVMYNEESQVTQVTLPYRYRRGLLRCGAYDGIVLPFIQQESTFWRVGIHRTVDFQQLSRFRLAGDAYLWSCFAEEADLYIVESYLGGFRRHAGQLSEDLGPYRTEVAAFAKRLSPTAATLARADACLWRAPAGIKKRMNSNLLLRYLHDRKCWA